MVENDAMKVWVIGKLAEVVTQLHEGLFQKFSQEVDLLEQQVKTLRAEVKSLKSTVDGHDSTLSDLGH